MDVSDLLDGLNDPQRMAVSHGNSPLLVLAGAGSGKTRVLVHRIAWLIRVQGLSPMQLFAVTFTNKAAAEMRHRIEDLLAMPVRGMWVGTFHGLAHRILRRYHDDANLPENFQIIDADDQQRIIKRILKELEIDETRLSAKQALWFVNQQKEEGVRARGVNPDGDYFLVQMKAIYTAYEALCQRSGLVDFAEILLRCFELLRDNEDLRRHFQQRFQHFLIDEFQDTNDIQYRLIRLLCVHNAITIVGDDDQSIYGWRGAKVENIQRFENDYENTKVVRLEQNYRSSATILAAANAVIDNNQARLGKNLWTAGEEGENISVYTAFNEQEEARFIAERIQQHYQEHHCYESIAVLYRSNAQSRVIEEALIREAIPYRIYGGFRFFERAEIKDTLSYLRLLYSRDDDAAFERVVNTPTRGIGDRSVQLIRDYAKEKELSLWRAAHSMLENQSLSGRAKNAVQDFMALIDSLANDYENLSLDQQIFHLIRDSGLFRMYQTKERGEKWQARKENLEELVNAAREFSQLVEDEIEVEDEAVLSPVAAFLNHAALEAGSGQENEDSDCVQMMTMHSAKGLEFPLVIMAGMEENLFPHQMSIEDPDGLEEERRLCYVGITRAMEKLIMTLAQRRRLFGKESRPYPSRFLSEIPANLIKEVQALPTWPTNSPSFSGSGSFASATAEGEFCLGQRIKHEKFGAGTILDIEGESDSAVVHINFDEVGSKRLVLAYAKLAVIP